MTNKTKKPRPMPDRIGLYVHESRDGNTYRLQLMPVTIGTTSHERRMIDEDETYRPSVCHDSIRNCGDEWTETRAGRLYLDGLTASAFGNHEDNPRHLYGWDLEYRQPYSVDLRRAERMAQTLKTIARRMEKENERSGRPLSFGQYAGRVALAIGATEIIIPSEGASRYSSYSDREHMRRDLAAGIHHIDHIARKWTDERKSA